jgi:hypothetical protein
MGKKRKREVTDEINITTIKVRSGGDEIRRIHWMSVMSSGKLILLSSSRFYCLTVDLAGRTSRTMLHSMDRPHGASTDHIGVHWISSNNKNECLLIQAISDSLYSCGIVLDLCLREWKLLTRFPKSWYFNKILMTKDGHRIYAGWWGGLCCMDMRTNRSTELPFPTYTVSRHLFWDLNATNEDVFYSADMDVIRKFQLPITKDDFYGMS